jgi:hypothetical protein
MDKPKEQSCPTDPNKDDCDQAWKDARNYCDSIAASGSFGSGRSVAGRNYQECLMGQVPQRCGGNRVEPELVPKKKRFFP